MLCSISGDVFGMFWEGVGDMFGGLSGMCLGHVLEDFVRVVDSFREDV